MQSAMLEPAKLADGTVTEYGFGWFVKPDRIWHTGTTTGFRTCILRDRATNATAIVLTNRSEADAMKIAEAALAK